MDTLLRDVRYAVRTMLEAPGFTLIAVMAFTLGIGANAAIFSVVNAVPLRPVPYKDPGRLVHVHRMQLPIERAPVSRPDFFEWMIKVCSIFNPRTSSFSEVMHGNTAS